MLKKILIIGTIVVLLDQIIKIFVNNYLISPFIVINEFFSFDKVYNTGAAFSIFNGQILFLIIINLCILIYLFKYSKSFIVNKKNILAFSLLIGGLVGNLIDRIMYGHVIDYIRFDFGDYTYPIFNVADMCVVVGIILLVVAIIKKEDVNEDNSR